MKKTETTTLLTYYIKCWIITRMISGMIDRKDNCRSWGPFPALSVYLICLNDSFLQRLGIQNIFAHNQPQINVQYLCILMLFMSFVLWEQKVFFSCTFYAAIIYIYTHIILVFHVVNVLFYQWKVIMILCHRAQRHGWMNWPVCHWGHPLHSLRRDGQAMTGVWLVCL